MHHSANQVKIVTDCLNTEQRSHMNGSHDNELRLVSCMVSHLKHVLSGSSVCAYPLCVGNHRIGRKQLALIKLHYSLDAVPLYIVLH